MEENNENGAQNSAPKGDSNAESKSKKSFFGLWKQKDFSNESKGESSKGAESSNESKGDLGESKSDLPQNSGTNRKNYKPYHRNTNRDSTQMGDSANRAQNRSTNQRKPYNRAGRSDSRTDSRNIESRNPNTNRDSNFDSARKFRQDSRQNSRPFALDSANPNANQNANQNANHGTISSQNITLQDGISGVSEGLNEKSNLGLHKDLKKVVELNSKNHKSSLNPHYKLDLNTKAKIRITPLGGLGEIGGNITVIESQNSAIIVDAGMSFPEADMHLSLIHI